MKKGIKYFVGVLIILGGLGVLTQKQFLPFLFLISLGSVILPPISDKLKQQYPIWEKKSVRYLAYFSLFVLYGVFVESISECVKPIALSPEKNVINYIKNNPQDVHMKNIAYLIETGKLFGDYNASLDFPEQNNRIYEQKDASEGFRRFMFRPQIDFQKAKEYLNEYKDYGYLKDYQVVFEVDSLGTIFNIKSVIKYEDTPFVGYNNENVPNIDSFINSKLVEKQKNKVEKKKQEAIAEKEYKKMMKDVVAEISANKLFTQYQYNEIRADELYKGKTIVVTGVISDIGNDILYDSYVTLKTNDIIGSVQCYLDKSIVSKLSKGYRITVKGECRGLLMNVLMNDCSLIE